MCRGIRMQGRTPWRCCWRWWAACWLGWCRWRRGCVPVRGQWFGTGGPGVVAVRGLARSMHSNFGFVPQNVMIAGCELHMAGYTDERMPQMQRRMLDAVAAIPGVTSVGYIDHLPLGLGGGDSNVFTDNTTD